MFKKGDKVKFIGDPVNHIFGKVYTISNISKNFLGDDYINLEESAIVARPFELELVNPAPEKAAKENIAVKKIDEIHITIGETTHHLSREEATDLRVKLQEELWS